MPNEPGSATGRLADLQLDDLYKLAVTDSLTGCYNRRFFDEIVERELATHRRYGVPVSLLFIDVDHFKAVNDSLGHEAGDRVLQSVASFLKRYVRRSDYLFRWGGDEFLILIRGTLQDATHMRALLRAAFCDLRDQSRLPPTVGLSIGCAEVSPDATDMASVVREADERMYEDRKGRGPASHSSSPTGRARSRRGAMRRRSRSTRGSRP